MIDYNKIKLAHQLTEKIKYGLFTIRHSDHDGTNYYFECPGQCEHIKFYSDDIDDMLEKLKCLLSPPKNQKYEIGQMVWYSVDVDIFAFTITGIYWDVDANDWMYEGKDDAMSESHLFLSAEELIQSQIKYWHTKYQERCSVTCNHEPHIIYFDSPNPTFQCNKCGKVYK